MAWNKANPATGIKAKSLDDHVRTNQDALETACNREHEFSTGGTVADQMHHRKGSARPFFQDSAPTARVDGTAFTAEDNGSLWVDTNSSPDNQFNILTDYSVPTWTPVSTEIIAVAVAAIHTWALTQTFSVSPVFTKGIVTNDAYLQGRNVANTANINIAKVNTSNGITLGAVTTLPDTSALATSGAPAADAQVANKKYVDDQTDPAYAGGQDHDFIGGLSIKTGKVSVPGAGTTVVTFAIAGASFSNNIISAFVTLTGANINESASVTAISAAAMTIRNGTQFTTDVFWIAIGH